jgi:predicted AlkP superfamily phosphohydrolase/phosphomutase
VRTCFHYSTESGSLQRLKEGLLTGASRRTAMFRSMIQSPEWDLFYGVYSESHCAGHLMWHLEDDSYPQHRPEQLAAVGHGLREIYQALDRALEELLSSVGADTVCAVLLSHGMGPNHHGGHLFPELVSRFLHRRAGTRPARRGDGAKGAWVDRLWRASVQSIPDRWRRGVRKHLPEALDAWLYIRRIEQARQWSRALAFPLPTVGPSLLRVNLKGRDPRGRIREGKEYSLFLDAFIQELSQVTNAETGEPAVDRIFRADRLVDPAKIGTSSDLTIWWSKSAPIRMIRSPSLGVMGGESRDIRTGEHVMRGALFLQHTSARPGRHVIDGMTPMDIPATLCELGGVRPEVELDGVSRLASFLAE